MPTEQIHLTRNQVAEYYGKVLKTKHDLKTSACCSFERTPEFIQQPLALIDEEIKNKFYGCGSPIPFVLKGMNVLDLGCGTGRDCYILSCLVGESGRVVGVDMTDEQLEVALRHLLPQMEKFGFKQPNVRFYKGYIEDLRNLEIPDFYPTCRPASPRLPAEGEARQRRQRGEQAGFDIVVSNCVVNLSPDKESVLREVYRVLKYGGEFFFSDVYADRRLPSWAKENPVLRGECLGGALYWKDFERMAKQTGFKDPRIFSVSKIDLFDKATIDKIGFAQFYSITYRLFKLPQLEETCEDFGQVAKYRGTIPESPHQFILDDHHAFEKNKPVPVCSNTAFMLSETRLKNHFEIAGDFSTHYGLFAGCGQTPTPTAYQITGAGKSPGGCC